MPGNTVPYVYVTLDATAILADAMMIRSLGKDPLSYFQSYKNYFVAIYFAFLAFPVEDLVVIATSEPVRMRSALQSVITAGAFIATIWVHVATILYLYPQPLSLRRILSGPFR